MIARLSLVVTLVAGLLAGCQTPPPEAYVAGGAREGAAAAVPIGANEAGEPCRFQVAASATGARRDALIYCGNWDQPSGRVSELAESTDAAQLSAVAASGLWRTYIDQRFACGAPVQTRILAGAPAVLMQCTRRVGGWPHVALTAIVGGRVFAADAVRPALPAVEATLAVMAGQAAPAAAAGSEARRLIAQRAGGGSFGSGDAGLYFQKLKLGDAYNNIDDPVNAERAYREALAIQQKVLGANDPGLALTMMKLGAQLAHQGNRAEADRLLTRAGELIAAKPDPLLAAQLEFYRATAAAYGGRVEEAITMAQRAEAAFARLAPGPVALAARSGGTARGERAAPGGLERVLSDESASNSEARAASVGVAEALRLRATLLQASGKTDEAGEVGRRTQLVLDAAQLSVTSTAARSLRLRASNRAVTGDYPQAAGTSAEASRIYERVTPGERPTAANLLSQGFYQLKSGRRDAAIDSFRRAGAILRGPMVVSSIHPEHILPWLDAVDGGSGDRTARASEMFEAAQYARTTETAQAIARATVALTAEDPKAAEAVRGFEDRKAQVERLERARNAAVDDRATAERIAELDRQIGEAARAQNEAEAAIQAVVPRYAQAAEKPATAAEVQKLLAPDEGLLFLFVADSGSYGFLVRRTDITAYKIPLGRVQITQAVTRLRDTTVAQPGGLPRPDFEASYRLYAALFGPIEQQFAALSRLTVAAAGDLLRYPLDALVTQAGVTVSEADYRQVPFLVRKLALAYVPAPRVLVNVRSARVAAAGLRPFIGFGDFRPASAGELAAAFPSDRCGDDYRYLQGLQPLPETRAQVINIGQQLGAGPGDILLGENFTKQALLTHDLGRYRIVLMATHAFFPTGQLRCMTEPAIALSPPPRGATAADAFLHPRTIEQLKLNADLVALSACNTSGAEGGESLAGLARAFFLAGSRGLLLTHWDVVTGASVPLMTATFAGGGSANSAKALQAAKLRLIDGAGSAQEFPLQISHPNFWSAFVLFGDGVRNGPGA